MEIINEHIVGITKGTQVEDAVAENYAGETNEVGLYLAMARQAQREGYPEVAEVLKTIADDEAAHAAQYAELNGLIFTDTKKNLQQMMGAEIASNNTKKEAAERAKTYALDHAHDFFDESSRDEARHALMLKGLLDRFFS
ncbi:MAG: rubrerythrin family protein [Planctomycetes bacterium]|nr:rubrerythrin family protein [Planctomycetota bacterium]